MDEVSQALDIIERLAGSSKFLILAVYMITPVMSYMFVQQVKRWLPSVIKRRMRDFEVRSFAWFSCFIFARVIGVTILGLPADNMVVHGFMIAVIYERFIKYLFKWAEKHNEVLLATLRNDRRTSSEPVDNERRKDDTQYTRY